MAGFCEEPLRAIGASAQASSPPSPLAVDPLAVQWVFPKGRVFTVLMPCLLPYFVLTWKGIIRSTPASRQALFPLGGGACPSVHCPPTWPSLLPHSSRCWSRSGPAAL